MAKYKRILLKLSGESLMGQKQYGIDEQRLDEYATQIADIVRLQLQTVSRHLAENGITLRVTDAAVHQLARAGFDPEFGARPVKRAIQRDLLNHLSRMILSANVNREQPIVADAEGDSIVFRN